MKMSFCSFWSSFGIALCCLTTTFPAQAQIVPDTTLPHNSQVTTQGNASVITGGTRAGRNLFHSFAQFSVPSGGIAYFNNDLNVQNIISRVTNSSTSNIDGVLRANGTANLILVNPKGIIFGQNARLNIGGSFLVTTADNINFADGTQFSATVPETTPLLTISVPIGLQFGTNQGGILVQGDGQGLRTTSNLIDTTEGLHVPSNQTLALVGSDVTLSGGTLKTAGGRIELGSVAGPGLVSLTQIEKGWALGYHGVQNLGNIQLSQQAEVDASGEGGGDIQVLGRRVTLTNGSQIETSTLGSKMGGTLAITGSELVGLMGTSADGQFTTALAAQVYPGATGAGGNLTINTGQLIVRDGAQIGSGTFGTGSGGATMVEARNSVELIGKSADGLNFSGLFSSAQPGAAGAGGNLTINTGQLIVRDGAQIFSGTFGKGAAGSLTVSARDSVELIGTGTPSLITPGSALATTVQPGATGAGGNLTINTGQLIVKGGAVVSTATFGEGKGGSLSVRAEDSVELSGPSINGFSGGLSARSGGAGEAGNLTINTGQLTVHNGAQLTARNDGTGNAGFLQINANSINLNNQGSITASTAFGEGGNIILNARDLRLRHNSPISATAGGNGNGGNIKLNTDTLVALENSNITANAVKGQGGNIQITAQGIFRSSDSAITASSQLGIDGTVRINTLDTNPGNTLTILPTAPVDVTRQIAQGCAGSGSNVGKGVSEFYIMGRGGLPPQPGEPLRTEALIIRRISQEDGRKKHLTSVNSEPSTLEVV